MADVVYPIHRIRLLNFHNFIDETITLEAAGHLFLLGDNGCGKTTILDAVHYVLTAGKGMEWNSAARLSGTKRDGRRVQGVILRYNLDTGTMNTGGAITYAALEIIGRNGNPLCIGMGLSATALDEQTGFWGFVRECTLETLPFLIEEGGQTRPASRQEFKQQLGSSHGFYSNRTAYRKDLGDRLFGGQESYLDICRFLSMGKSYREISAGAADYHQLFKSLLPEPRTSLFEQIIEALRTLDESQVLLDDLARKLAWLKELDRIRAQIGEAGEGILRYDWLLHHFTLEQKKAEQVRCRQRLKEKHAEIQQAKTDQAELEQRARALDDRLQNLRTKDGTGLVRQEKSVKDEWERKKQTLHQQQKTGQKRLRELNSEEKRFARMQDGLRNQLKSVQKGLTRFGTDLPFSIAAYQAGIDALGRAGELTGKEAPAIQETIRICDTHIQEAVAQQSVLTEQHKSGTAEITRLQDQIARLEKQSEIKPQLDGYERFERALRNEMISVKPLYQGLEWAASVSGQQRRYIEECIGEQKLATLIFRESEYERAAARCVDFPGLHLARDRQDTAAVPDWMRQVFSIRESDPACLVILAQEMETSGLQPAVRMVDGQPVLAFRAHEQRLFDRPARLVGSDSRRHALAAEIRDLNTALKAQNREHTAREKQLKLLTSGLALLQAYKTFINEQNDDVQHGLQDIQTASYAVNSIRLQYDTQQTIARDLQNEVSTLELQLRELNALIAREGLQNLEKRISRLKKNLKKTNDQKEALIHQRGGYQHEAEGLEQTIATIDRDSISLNEQKESVEENLSALLEPGIDPAHYILKTRKGQQFKSVDAISKESENCRVAKATSINELKLKINDPEFGGVFRFNYEEEPNQLYDYRQQVLSVIIDQQTAALAEQQEVINDRTRELFKKIIMTDLMNYLRGHVGEMEHMVRRINTLLKTRSFGGQRYSFTIRPLDEYKRLINIIKKINPFDPKGETELESFFADNRDAILATEAGAIPDELDYRNWYRYEMRVATLDEEGKVIDRRNKSLGSGGEQAVPNYLLILTIAHFMYRGKKMRLHALLFDEAFYGIDAGRRDQILGFATDLGLQLFIASPDQDGVRQEVRNSTTLLVKKDSHYDVHLFSFHWKNPENRQIDLFEPVPKEPDISFGDEL